MSSWKVLLCWENPVRNVSFNVIRGLNVEVRFTVTCIHSLLQASSLPLLISSPQRLTAWWCRFVCILFRVWLLHLRSMCGGALSGPPHKGQEAGPVVWLNLLVCLSVCIISVLYLRTCSCSLKVTFGMDQNCY